LPRRGQFSRAVDIIQASGAVQAADENRRCQPCWHRRLSANLDECKCWHHGAVPAWTPAADSGYESDRRATELLLGL